MLSFNTVELRINHFNFAIYCNFIFIFFLFGYSFRFLRTLRDTRLLCDFLILTELIKKPPESL